VSKMREEISYMKELIINLSTSVDKLVSVPEDGVTVKMITKEIIGICNDIDDLVDQGKAVADDE